MYHPFTPRALATAVVFGLCFVWLGAAVAERQQAGPELRFLNRSEYMDPELLREFEGRFGAKVTVIHFESDEMRDDLLLETDGEGYDVILSGGISLRAYRRRGWLARFGQAQVANLKHLDRRWFDLFPESRGYAAPYFWGTTGIGYRQDLVGRELDSWMEIYRPAESLRGRIYLNKSGRDVIGMALKALNYSANSTDSMEIGEAEKLLLEQKPFVRAYAYPVPNEHSPLVTGEIHTAMMSSGDALMVKQHHPEISYVLPKEGGSIWVDYLTVGQASRRKGLAHKFINFLNEPVIAARLARFVHCATPNRAAEALLPRQFLEDPIIYPGPEALKRSEIYTHLPPRALRRRNSIFARLLQ